MKLTITKIQFMHGNCSDSLCPICNHGSYDEIDKLLRNVLTVGKSGFPFSPWCEVSETNEECYKKLHGDLRWSGYYDEK